MDKLIIDEALLIRYFSKEISVSEEKRIEDWISSSKENKDLAKQIYYIYIASETVQTIKQTDSKKALRNVTRKAEKQRRAYLFRRVQRIAAVFTIPLLFTTFYLLLSQISTTNEYVEVRTNPGMITTVTLPDSSKVWLNSDSYLKYPAKFTGKTRDIILNGEAFFEVEKDPKRKFIVSTTHNMQIEVLGTEFNVEAYSRNRDITTTLVSGEINLLYSSAENNIHHLLMTPNQKTIINTSNRTAITTSVNVEPYIAWKDGKIIFNDTSLEDALRILSKRFNVQFIIKDPKLKEYSFSGTFVYQRLDRILEHFKISSNIKSRYITTDDNSNKIEKSVIEIY